MMKKLLPLMLILSTSLLTSVSSFGASPKSSSQCTQKMRDEFRDLYLNLAEYLNYSGTDASHDNEKVILNEHQGTDYNGQIFEKVLYHEHQNALKKVAKILQGNDKKIEISEKNFGSTDKDFNAVIKFFQSADKDASGIKNIKIDKFLSVLKDKGDTKFTSDGDQKYKLNGNDIYLLQKLLIHAQDMTVRFEKYEKFKNDPRYKKYAKAGDIPLAQMLTVLKDANKLENPDLNLIPIANANEALVKTVNDQMNTLKKWLRENSICRDVIMKNPSSIQAGIQSSNFRKFINALSCSKDTPPATLSDYNLQNLEAILQFINSNQKHGKIEAKADTGLKLEELNRFVANTFKIAVTPPTDPPVPPVQPEEKPKMCNKETCNKLTAVGVINWDDKDKTCYSTPVIGKDRIKLCSDLILPNPPEVADDTAKKKEECEEKDRENDTRTPMNKWVWNESKKECKDRKPATKESEEDTAAEAKPDVVYPNKPVPGRFQPITIPTRQVYILPGMP